MEDGDQEIGESPVRPAEVLRRRRDRIVERWMRIARAEVPAAAVCDDETLRDSLPEYLDLLSCILESGAVERCENPDVSANHARQRAGLPSYTVDQVMLEYRLLRRIVFEEMQSEVVLTARDRDLLHEAIDTGIGQAGAAFMEVLLSRRDGSIRALHDERERRQEFVIAVIHDVRNPLHSARLASEVIERHRDSSAPLRGYARKVAQNIDRADRMIQDLLDAHRIGAGEKLALQPQEADLVALVREAVGELAALHGAHFVVEAEGPIHGRFGADAIRRIIANLGSNAVKYGDEGAPVSVLVAADGATATLLVRNQGPGLSAEEQQRLFEPFQRLPSAQRSGKPGWGIGLTIVRGLVSAHGGAVTVRSAPGDGVTFVVELPLSGPA